MMKCLVTGASGFVGGYLVEHLVAERYDICASGRVFDHSGIYSSPNVSLSHGNIEDEKYVDALISNYRPDVIYHLAAQSYPRVSWESPASTFESNVVGTVNVLEAARSQRDCRIVSLSSSAVYGPVTTKEPINEDAQLLPVDPYGLTKLVQEQLATMYIERYGMDIVSVRPFFLIGPRKTGDVCSDFSKGIVAIEKGARTNIEVGNLNIVRDFLDVRDGVTALVRVALSGVTGEAYNISSGNGYSLQFILESLKRFSKTRVNELIDKARIRPGDQMFRIGSAKKICELDWGPTREIEGTLFDIIEYWRSHYE